MQQCWCISSASATVGGSLVTSDCRGNTPTPSPRRAVITVVWVSVNRAMMHCFASTRYIWLTHSEIYIDGCMLPLVRECLRFFNYKLPILVGTCTLCVASLNALISTIRHKHVVLCINYSLRLASQWASASGIASLTC